MSKPKLKPSKVTGMPLSKFMKTQMKITKSARSTFPLRRHVPSAVVAMCLGAASLVPAAPAFAGFALQGQGIQTVANGSVANGALFMETRSTWTNTVVPDKPYVVEVGFALPACDAVPVGRLVMTVWGGTANYVCNLGVQINGTHVPLTAPLAFGTTNDANAVFSESLPSVYGAGSGVWLVGLPVPGNMLFKDGTSNHVQLTVTTPDSFDGRINQVTLLAVYQAAALNNIFDYAVAEGSGDIYRTPSGAQVDARAVLLGAVNPTNATAARLQVLYTYADIGQNDRLYFNDSPLGGNDVAGWDKVASGLDFGPNVLSFDVLGSLTASNTVRFSVSATDVPDTRETSLRPQLAVLTVARPPQVMPPALAIGLNAVIAWPVSADTCQLEFRPNADAGEWTAVTNVPVVINGQNTVILPPAAPRQFYQLRKTN
jgi:hypothetical protein